MNIRQIVLFFSFIGIIFSSCSKSNGDGSGSNSNNYPSAFNYEKDGTAVVVTGIYSDTTNGFLIQGDNLKYSLKMTFPYLAQNANHDPINIPVSGVDPYFSVKFKDKTINADYEALDQKGLLTITNHDTAAKILEGDFWVTCHALNGPVDSVVITNGHFAIKYIQE